MALNLTTGYPSFKGDSNAQLASLQIQFCSLIDELAFLLPQVEVLISSAGADNKTDSNEETQVV